jgi:hypothetical protein
MLREALAAASIATLGLAACEMAPTPYQPATASAPGYSEMRIENDRYRVSFSGNSSTPRDVVETYMLYRAAELTLQSGGIAIPGDGPVIGSVTGSSGTFSYV